jgi:cell division protein FtsQ
MKKVLYICFIIPLCILSMLTIVYIFSKDEPFFFVKNIKINGIEQLKDGDVMGRITPYLKESLINIDASKMQESIIAHPFVREVRIKRIYPFSIIVDVKEKRPSALWVNAEGEVNVLDENGEPYKKLDKSDLKGMFIINAKEITDAKSLFKEINAWFAEGVIKNDTVSEVAYKDGSITIFGMGDGVEIILGKEDQRGRLKRAVAVLEDAKKRGLLIKCIDARFEKGAIIQERKG